MTADPRATADRILDFLRTEGTAEYHGEKVSQLEHSLQAAHLARLEGAGEEEVIAALLHDIGHMWPVEGTAGHKRRGRLPRRHRGPGPHRPRLFF